ncbi:hypothetical protein GGF37_004926 [Kickxella alabastrina]|nr:hypothetical protein GGF37_004926 [Kickxella alabastrina]
MHGFSDGHICPSLRHIFADSGISLWLKNDISYSLKGDSLDDGLAQYADHVRRVGICTHKYVKEHKQVQQPDKREYHEDDGESFDDDDDAWLDDYGYGRYCDDGDDYERFAGNGEDVY